LTATASDNVAVANVQFKVDGSNIGSAITSSPYTTNWNSTGVSDGSHTLYAVAEDTSGNYATSSINVTDDNTAPIVSSIASSTDDSSATITWTTNEAATSKVVFGPTSAYGSATSSVSLVTSHSIGIIGLTDSTTYHYAVVSTDAVGNTATSSDKTFTTATSSVAIVKNIVTDFGATCNGSGNDNSAFTAFNTWALNWQQSNSGLIELDIPLGAVCMFTSGGGGNFFAKGIKQLKVTGYGATLSDNGGAGNGFFLGGAGEFNDNAHSARVATVAAGASSVTLLTPSQTSLFTFGNYALMTGLDMQGYGYPSNQRFFEYVKVASINSGTGVITFTAPLTNSYESTWPLYTPGGAFQIDEGGPATLYALDPSWDTQVEYDGLTIAQQGQTYANGRSVTYKDVTFTGSGCGVPTQDMSFAFENVSATNCDIEVDKLIDSLTIASSTIRQLLFQSASVNTFTMSSSTITNTMNGSPIDTHMNNVTIANVAPGAYAYGESDEFDCTNCVLSNVTPLGFSTSFSSAGYTMQNGVIASNDSSNGPVSWAVPGKTYFLGGTYAYELPFSVTDITQTGTTTYVHTSLGGGLPPIFGGVASVKTDPAPEFTCTNCTGSADAVDLSGAPPGAPLWSYSKRTYTGNTASALIPIFGKLDSVEVNVTTPYTGGSSLNFNLDGPFILTGTARTIWSPTVNPKVAGERDITATTTSGAQSGDSITAPGQGTWLLNNQITPQFNTNISGQSTSSWPVITLEMQTDQTPDTSPPSTPGNLLATATSSSEIDLAWNASTDNFLVLFYSVFRDNALIATTTSTSYNDTGLASSTTHLYTVQAVDLSGNVSASAATSSATTSGGGGNSNVSVSELDVFSPNPAIAPSSYYTPGVGNPAISTADYYDLDGLYWFRPYDLDAFGSQGQAIASSSGRYFWIASPDHPSGNYGWAGGQDFVGGFSNDPAVFPATMHSIIPYNNDFVVSGCQYSLYQAPWLVYNPDDSTHPFYLYAEGSDVGGSCSPTLQHEEGLAISSDLTNWTMQGATHPNLNFGNWSSFQRVYRVGTGNWYSTGLGAFFADDNAFGNRVWTSTDGKTFALASSTITNDRLPAGCGVSAPCTTFYFSAADNVTYNGQLYAVVTERTGTSTGPQYVSLAPIDSNFNVVSSTSVIRIAGPYDGVYPGPGFVQSVNAYQEDGILNIYVERGFFPSSSNQSLVNGATYANGGGLWQEFIDYYTKIIDPAAAANAAPLGVQASTTAGVVGIGWLNALPNNTYRVYRSASASGPWTLVGNVMGTYETDTPTTGQQWYYKVVTLDNGVEEQNRIVHTYVSSAPALVNTHINRVIDDGAATSTINASWLTSVVNWLSTNGLTDDLLFWTDPAFGVQENGNVIEKVYDLGTTILPRGGDYTPYASSTTYSATGLNNTAPAWVNGSATSFGYYGSGRLNNIRRETQATVVAAYQKGSSAQATLLGMDEFGGMAPQETAGSPGYASFFLTGTSTTVTATSSLSGTGAHIVAGTFDGTTLTSYADGTAGTGQTGLPANTDLSANTELKGLIGTETNVPFLGSGSQNSKYTIGTGYVFENAEAQFSGSDLIVFDKALTSLQMTSLTSLLHSHIFDTTPPSTPTNLSATPISSSEIDLSWTASNDNGGGDACCSYKIFRGGSQVGTTTSGTSYDDTGLTASTTYTYALKAFDAAGNISATSTTAATSTLAGGGEPVISSIASTTNSSSATVSWSTDESANSRVDYGPTASYGSATTSSSLVTSHSLVITGLASSTVYHFRVQSTDGSSNTATSTDLTFTTTAPAGSTTTFDPSHESSHIALSGGNLIATSGSGSSNGTNVVSVGSDSTGKHFVEFTLTTKTGGAGTAGVGLINTNFLAGCGGTCVGVQYLGADENDIANYDDGTVLRNGANQGTITSFGQGDVIDMAVDLDAQLVWFRVNGGNWNNSGSADPTTGTGGYSLATLAAASGYPLYAAVEGESNGDVWTGNFGATSYAHAAPSGFGNW